MKNLLLLTLGITFFLVACSEAEQENNSIEAGFNLRPGSMDEGPAASEEAVEENTEPEHHGHHHHNGPQEANDMLEQTELNDLISHFESPDRVEWQKPDEIVEMLGEIENKVVMDLGAGSGYFAFRLQEAGAHVIAAEVDDRLIGYLNHKRDSLEIPAMEFDVRKVFFDDPLLGREEVDVFFTVDTYHHIDRRDEYLQKVLQGIRPGGKLVIVDFKKGATPHGPPVNIRLHHTHTEAEVAEAGFSNIAVDTSLLPEQYILIAEKSN